MEQFSQITVNYKPSRPLVSYELANSSSKAENLLRALWSDRICYKEEFYILLLAPGCRALGFAKVGEGGNDYTPVNVREVIQTALMANAASVVLAHNHPSGTLKPSTADLEMTRKLEAALKYFDISVADHIILAEEGYYSFRDDGLL